MKRLELSGKRFNKWLVIEMIKKPEINRILWVCQCDCGQKKEIYTSNLTSGKSKQCKNCSNIIHGKTKSHTYTIYYSMLQRCLNPKHKNFNRYGGRGIKICDRWLKSFTNFLEDMGEIPKNLCIDRIDNNGNYTKKNCRLVTHRENMNNRNNSIVIGSKSNDWEVIKKDEKPRNYIISCTHCKFTRSIRGAYIKKTQKHGCEKKI